MPNSDNIRGRRSSILPSLSWKKSSEIEIVLDGDYEFVRSYSTFDEITGHVNLKFEKDTCIDDLIINLQGTTTTWIEKIATASPTMGRTTGKHTFLRVRQPIDESCLPEFNKALAGETYTIPFKFVVPDRILDFICSHKVDQDAVRDQHLQLPPSMGNPMLAGKGNTLMDDLSPVMAKIVYSIRVALLKASPSIRKPEVVEEELGIRIIPAREELPPISLDLLSGANAGKYCLRKEKNVRKGLFKIGKKQGRLTAETLQPASLKLHHPSHETDEPIATMTTVQLRFDPASEDEQPPPLSNMTNKLKIHTFFGASAWSYFPVPDGYDIYSTLHSQYPDSIELSTRNLSNVEWTKHESNSPATTVSVTSKASIPSAYERRSSKVLSTSVSSSAGTHGSRSIAHTSFSRRASTFSNASSSSSAMSSDEEVGSNVSGSEASSSIVLAQAKSNSSISPSEAYNPILPYYTTSIVVPITLPSSSSSNLSTTTSPSASRRPSMTTTNSQTQSSSTSTSYKPGKRTKPTIFLPTFHSCLVSRVYALDLSISAHSTPTINLRVPLQISLPYSDRNATHAAQNPASYVASDSIGAPPAWSNPFSTSTDLDLANDEALARALSQSYNYDDLDYQSNFQDHVQMQSKQRRNTTQLDDVPEYEATPSRNINVSPQNRHASLVTPMNDDLPPEYNAHNNVRRVSAARRAAASIGRDSSASHTTTTASVTAPATTAINSNTGESSRRRRSGLFGSSGSSSGANGASTASGAEGGRVNTGFPRKGSISRGFSLLL